MNLHLMNISPTFKETQIYTFICSISLLNDFTVFTVCMYVYVCAHIIVHRVARVIPATMYKIVCAAGEPAAAEVASACFDRSRGP